MLCVLNDWAGPQVLCMTSVKALTSLSSFLLVSEGEYSPPFFLPVSSLGTDIMHITC